MIAFFTESERHHDDARKFVQRYPNVHWLVLETVFDEFVTWVRARISIPTSIELGRLLRMENPYLHISDEDDVETWDVFCKYKDKSWSYTDCSILVHAKRLGVNKVFTFDDHFEQMRGLGIEVVPHL